MAVLQLLRTSAHVYNAIAVTLTNLDCLLSPAIPPHNIFDTHTVCHPEVPEAAGPPWPDGTNTRVLQLGGSGRWVGALLMLLVWRLLGVCVVLARVFLLLQCAIVQSVALLLVATMATLKPVCYHVCAAHELSTRCIAGFTLGGGFGWLGRYLGLGCDSLLEVKAVLADGSIVTANEGESKAVGCRVDTYGLRVRQGAQHGASQGVLEMSCCSDMLLMHRGHVVQCRCGGGLAMTDCNRICCVCALLVAVCLMT